MDPFGLTLLFSAAIIALPTLVRCCSTGGKLVSAYRKALADQSERDKWDFGKVEVDGEECSYLDLSLPNDDEVRIPVLRGNYEFEFFTTSEEDEDDHPIYLFTTDVYDRQILPMFRPKYYNLSTVTVEVKRPYRNEKVRFKFEKDDVVDIIEIAKKYEVKMKQLDEEKPLAEAFD